MGLSTILNVLLSIIIGAILWLFATEAFSQITDQTYRGGKIGDDTYTPSTSITHICDEPSAPTTFCHESPDIEPVDIPEPVTPMSPPALNADGFPTEVVD